MHTCLLTRGYVNEQNRNLTRSRVHYLDGDLRLPGWFGFRCTATTGRRSLFSKTQDAGCVFIMCSLGC